MYTCVGGGGGYSVVQTARYIQTECTVLFSLAQTNLSTVACEDNKEDIKLKKRDIMNQDILYTKVQIYFACYRDHVAIIFNMIHCSNLNP